MRDGESMFCLICMGVTGAVLGIFVSNLVYGVFEKLMTMVP